VARADVVELAVGVAVGLGVAVAEAIGLGVPVGLGVAVAEAIGLGVPVGLGVAVAEAIGLGVPVGLGVAVAEAIELGVPVGLGVAVAEAIGLGSGVVVSSGVVVGTEVGAVSCESVEGVAEGPGTGLEASDCGMGLGWMNQSTRLLFVSWVLPPDPPGRRSMLDFAGGAGATDPSTYPFVAVPHPTPSMTAPSTWRSATAPPSAASPPA
jgi:hypothetical protein